MHYHRSKTLSAPYLFLVSIGMYLLFAVPSVVLFMIEKWDASFYLSFGSLLFAVPGSLHIIMNWSKLEKGGAIGYIIYYVFFSTFPMQATYGIRKFARKNKI